MTTEQKIDALRGVLREPLLALTTLEILVCAILVVLIVILLAVLGANIDSLVQGLLVVLIFAAALISLVVA